MVANAVGGEALVKAEAAKRWPKASLYKGFATDNNRHSGQRGRDNGGVSAVLARFVCMAL